MLYAIIEHKNNTLIMEFPCRRITMAEHLASVGIRTPAHEIKCVDEENIPVKVKIFGESEFGKKLASVIYKCQRKSEPRAHEFLSHV